MSRRTCNYPLSIVPKKNYILRLDIDSLLAEYDLFIVRRLDAIPTKNRMGNLHSIGLYTNDIPDMSNNLLGGEFHPQFLSFITKGKASTSWNGEKVIVKDFGSESYKQTNDFKQIYIPVKKLHQLEMPVKTVYNKNFTKNNPNFQFERKQDDNQDSMISEMISEIKHEPTMFNYWHVVLQIQDKSLATPIKNAANNLQKSICDTIIENVITKFASNNIPTPIYKIDKKHYLLILKKYAVAI